MKNLNIKIMKRNTAKDKKKHLMFVSFPYIYGKENFVVIIQKILFWSIVC